MNRNKKQLGNVHVVLVAAIVVMLCIALGALFYLNVMTKPIATDSGRSTDRSTGSRSLKAGSPATTQGWRTYESKKYGIRFEIPSYWVVNESDGDTAVDGYTVNVQNPNDNSGGFELRVTDGKSDEQAAQVASTMNKLPGYTATTAATKWQGYDATRLTATIANESSSTLYLDILYIQIGLHTYSIPGDSAFADLASSTVAEQNAHRFITSITIRSTP